MGNDTKIKLQCGGGEGKGQKEQGDMEREEERKNGVWGDRNKRKDVYRHINQSQYMYNY